MDLNNHPTIEHQILRGQVYYKTQLICSLFKFEKKRKVLSFSDQKRRALSEKRKEKKKKKKEKNPHPFFPLLFPLLIEFSIPVEGFIRLYTKEKKERKEPTPVEERNKKKAKIIKI